MFSATWAGSIVALHEGTYTLATVSDDESSVFVDGQLVVDNGGRHGAQLATGIGPFPRHSLMFIRYAQDGGDYPFDFLWGTRRATPNRFLHGRSSRAKVSIAKLQSHYGAAGSLSLRPNGWVAML